MTLLSVCLAVVLATNGVLSVSSWPGLRQVSVDTHGNAYLDAAPKEGAENIRYWVADYKEMTPTVVYNCKWLPTLCLNAVAYLGAGNNGPVSFHYDRTSERATRRRDHACSHGWADDHCTNLVGLPDWYTDMDGGARAYHAKQACAKDPKRYYYEKANEFDEDSDPKLARTGAIASCDEFPTATWI